jgi:hypothetical protein
MNEQDQTAGGAVLGPPPLLARSLALILALLAVLSGCGAGASSQGEPEGAGVTWFGPSRRIPGLDQRIVGNGVHAAVLLWSKGKPLPREAVVFLHAWLPRPPSVYGAWLYHLAERGNTIVYPVYQQAATKPEAFLDNAIAGITAGLRAAHADPTSLVTVGETTGAALAFDYAAVATERGLPGPRGALAAFPGRNPGNGEVIPTDLSRIPPPTLLEVIAGPGDPIPGGEAQARALLRAATAVPNTHRRYLTAPRFTGPTGVRPPSRRAFWVPLDRLIAAVRGSS